MWQSGNRTHTVVLLLCMALLPLLAVLQYRWVGRLSAAEEERMRRNLHTAAEQFAAEFHAELARAAGTLIGERPFLNPDPETEYASRYAAWNATSRHQGMVKGVYLTRGEAGITELLRLDPVNLRFVREPWPARFGSLQRRLAPDAPPPVPPWEETAVSILVFGPEVQQRRRPPLIRHNEEPPRRLPGWCVVEFDRGYLAGTYLPELASRYFMRNGAFEYRVQVLAGNGEAAAIYDSQPGGGAMTGRPDAAATLLFSAPAPLRRPGPPAIEAPPPHVPWPERGWILAVQHQSGGLETVVRGVRMRNLAVSFAVLLLLGGSMAALVATTRRAQRLARLEMEFVAGVSHELRTPLAVIRSAGENLADGVASSEAQVKQYGRLIRDEGRRLSDLVEQVMAFARSASTKTSLKRLVSIPRVLEDALAAAAPELGGSEGRVSREIAPDLPGVEGDQAALTLSVRNLLSNAARHGGGSPIRVSARHVSERVEIAVEDGGPGIEPEDLAHIFDPFYRGRRAGQQQIRGIGLGLSLVKRIAEAHGGSVSATSALGSGARFVLALPVASTRSAGGES